jgi:gliding motility-associated protein GldC
MKRSTIQLTIELDDKNIPEKILWDATDKPDPGPSETKAIGLSIWDPLDLNTLRIDLWIKDMPVDHMKRYYIECISGLAQSALQATGDEKMVEEMNALCESLVKYVGKS